MYKLDCGIDSLTNTRSISITNIKFSPYQGIPVWAAIESAAMGPTFANMTMDEVSMLRVYVTIDETHVPEGHPPLPDILRETVRALITWGLIVGPHAVVEMRAEKLRGTEDRIDILFGPCHESLTLLLPEDTMWSH